MAFWGCAPCNFPQQQRSVLAHSTVLLGLSCSPGQSKDSALGAPSKPGLCSRAWPAPREKLPRAIPTGKQSPSGTLSVPRGGGSSVSSSFSFSFLVSSPLWVPFHHHGQDPWVANFSLAEGFWIPQLSHPFPPAAAVSNPSFSLPTMTSSPPVCSNLG